jgi:hypothetical protein
MRVFDESHIKRARDQKKFFLESVQHLMSRRNLQISSRKLCSLSGHIEIRLRKLHNLEQKFGDLCRQAVFFFHCGEVGNRLLRVMSGSIFFFTIFSLVSSGVVFAQTAPANSLSITLTPPLFQITQAPGTQWQSMLRVVNTNPYDIVLSASVTDFHPDGETGNAVLENIPVGNATDTHRLSGWISIPTAPITVLRGKTGEIPFAITVPVNADPGGHYAAVVVGTSPLGVISGSGATVSSAVTSLIFLRVPGEVVEEGAIRDFYAEKSLVQTLDASFTVRFENKGNVHLVPQGEILITNMWGKERGKILINETNTFGNVLPGATRKFAFDWHGEWSPFEVGRYKASAALTYGDEGRKTAYREAYFWVVPWKPVLFGIGGFLSFVWFIGWSVRRYVRNVLRIEREHLGIQTPSQSTIVSDVPAVKKLSRRSLETKELPRREGSPLLYRAWVREHRPAIVFFSVLFSGLLLISWYFVEVFQDERAYQTKELRGSTNEEVIP